MRRSDYKPLGNYIELVNVRNRDLAITNLVGVSIEKKFIPSIANIIGTDLSPYKIIRQNQFAYGPVTSRNGEKITIALYKNEEDGILSQAYEVFKIKDEEQMLPEYLMLWVKRPEFDRYARYKSHGSVRELFTWEEMCNVMLPVPPIEEQRRIVNEYQTVERRIANNEKLIQKLEETAQAIYYHTFVEGIDENNLPEGWRMGCIQDIVTVKDGTHDSPKPEVEGFPLLTSAHLRPYELLFCETYNISEKDYDKINERSFVEQGDILYSMIGTIGAMHYLLKKERNFAIKNMALFKTSQSPLFAAYLYLRLKSEEFKQFIKSSIAGSTQNYVTLEVLRNAPILIATENEMESFDKTIKPIFDYINILSCELHHLRELLTLLTSKLA